MCGPTPAATLKLVRNTGVVVVNLWKGVDLMSGSSRPVGTSCHVVSISPISQRGENSLGAIGRIAAKASDVVDPRIPVGWLGDVVLLNRPKVIRPVGS